MGNPHCVVFVDDVERARPRSASGPRFEHHPFFPRRVNTEFVRVASPDAGCDMRVWERGSGETLACGTGACAAAVAAVADRAAPSAHVTVALPRRRARDRVARRTTTSFMTGDAVEVVPRRDRGRG